MWDQILSCMSAREVALCIPWGGTVVPLVYWYGILASVGIFVGAFYASKHVEMEGENPDIVWDMLLWLLVPALLGGRLWYVGQNVLGGNTGGYSWAEPLRIINPRDGGMNIFGAAIAGLIALIIYVRAKKLNGWLLADAALLALFAGQGIGRIGNFINVELYGPPTNSTWFGMLVPETDRISEYANLSLYPPDTRFHPTMFYEAFWLFLCFGVLAYLFRRNQKWFIHGTITGLYLMLAGVGRFIVEAWRPDQPAPLTMPWLSYSRMVSLLYVVVGLIIFLDRLGYMKIPFIPRPQTRRQRDKAFEEIQVKLRRLERARERERIRDQRRKERQARREMADDTTSTEELAAEPERIEEA